MKDKFNLFVGISYIIFGFLWGGLGYYSLGKPMCEGGFVSFAWTIPYYILGVAFIVLGSV